MLPPIWMRGLSYAAATTPCCRCLLRLVFTHACGVRVQPPMPSGQVLSQHAVATECLAARPAGNAACGRTEGAAMSLCHQRIRCRQLRLLRLKLRLPGLRRLHSRRGAAPRCSHLPRIAMSLASCWCLFPLEGLGTAAATCASAIGWGAGGPDQASASPGALCAPARKQSGPGWWPGCRWPGARGTAARWFG